MLRVGLVGLGDAGQHHGGALAALEGAGALAWAAVCARDEARIERFRAHLAVPARVASFGDLDALLASRACDAVILATPDGIHAEQVERCAERGVHVLVEKPLALTHADGARAVARCRAAGVHLGVGYHLRHHAGHRMLQARRVELIGALRHVDVRWAWPDPATGGWRARGDAARFWSLAALGTHGIDLAAWLAGKRIERVAGLLHPAEGADHAADVSLLFAGGVLAHLSVAVTHRAIPRVVVTGERGEIECTGTLGARGDGAIAWRALREAPVPLTFVPENPYEAQLRDFVARAGGEAADEAPLDAAVENLAVLDRLAEGATRSL